MRSIMKTPLAVLAATTMLSGAALADGHGLSGDLRIFSDMSNPAPRAIMEGLVEQFGEMHPNLNIELTVVDREAWKTQIRNVLVGQPIGQYTLEDGTAVTTLLRVDSEGIDGVEGLRQMPVAGMLSIL